jgi:hypothetical protein
MSPMDGRMNGQEFIVVISHGLGLAKVSTR